MRLQGKNRRIFNAANAPFKGFSNTCSSVPMGTGCLIAMKQPISQAFLSSKPLQKS
jgi:hypothetical protein